MPYVNTDRFAVVNSHLGEDVLMLSELKGSEGLSKLFSFELSLLSEDHEIAFADIIGRDLTVAVDVGDEQRFFHGIVASFTQQWIANVDEGGADLSLYTAGVVPRLWLLTRYRSSRIFQEKTILEIIEQILGERDIADYRFDLDKDKYESRGYCVQYRETDYEFVCRLLEDEGIYFYFEHENGKHTWVLTDGSVGHKACHLQDTVFFDTGVGDLGEGALITDLVIGQQIRSSRYTLKDFDFEQPDLDLTVSSDAGQDLAPGPGDRELYDYPGSHLTLDEGDRRSRLRIEEEEAQVTTINGVGGARTFASGFLFTLERYGRADMNGKQFLLTKVEHHLKQPGFHSEAAGADKKLTETLYENRFECMSPEMPFRPRRTTRKPAVKGPQTAIVVGPEGEDIHVDKYGRVKVQFHWDREGQGDDNSSCWVRVSQAWAGNGWGSMHIPHVGHEVIVSFLEGDPDRPMVTGRVFNGMNQVPEGLPDNKRKSVFRDDYGNELIFDGTEGDEHIRLHSPHHNSTFEIGKSIGGYSASDHFNYMIGNTVELGAGDNHSAFAGQTFEVKMGTVNEARVGLATEIDLGGRSSLLVGQSSDFHFGPEVRYHLGATLDLSENTKSSIAEKDNIISANGTINLIGGAGGGPKSSPIKSSSIIEGDHKKLTLSVGCNKNPNSSYPSRLKRSLILATPPILSTVALVSGVLSPLFVNLLGVLGSSQNNNPVQSKEPSPGKDSSSDPPPNWVAGGIGLGWGTTATAISISIAIIQFTITQALLSGSTDKVSHFDKTEGADQDEANAAIRLNQDGTVKILGSKKITLGHEESITKNIDSDETRKTQIMIDESEIEMKAKGGWRKMGSSVELKGRDLHLRANGKVNLYSNDQNIVINAKSVDIANGAIKAQK